MSEFNSIDDFLNHKGNEFSGGKFLKKDWKKDKGSIHVWLHTKRLPVALWQHNIPTKKVFQSKDGDDDPSVTFWGVGYNCWEDETVLKKMRSRNPDGTREVPPKVCPICKLTEYMRAQIDDGKIDWLQEVFKYDGATESKDNLIVRAGGIVNMFSGKLSDEEKKAMRKVHVQQSEGFKQSMMCKLNYAFVLVNHDRPADGVQIMVETSLLGEKVKRLINDAIASDGDEGNPMIHPYCIQMLHNSDAGIPFQEKYNARAIRKTALSPEIERLITGDPPSLDRIIRKPNSKTLRAMLEQYSVIDLPLDEFFKDVPEDEEEDESSDFPPKDEEPPPRRRTSAKAAPKEPEPPPEGSDTIPCDKCQFPMLETETKCRKCGEEYEIDDSPPPAKEKAAAGGKKGNGKDDKLGF